MPVIPNGSRAEVVGSAIINSALWSYVTILELTQNMRLSSSSHNLPSQQSVAAFSRWILDVGEGNIQCTARDGEIEPSWIKIPDELLLTPHDDNLQCIVDAIYPNLQLRYTDDTYLRERAILCPTNEIADSVNSHVVS